MPGSTDLLTASEAAEVLGVTRQSLYAYVSRGLLASREGPGPSRARRYLRDEVERLRAGRIRSPGERAAAETMHFGLPVLESRLTLIGDGRLYYRGRDAVELSRSATLEDVAALLWTGNESAGRELFAGQARQRRARAKGSLLERLERHLQEAAPTSLASMSSPVRARLRAGAELVTMLFTVAGAVGEGDLAGVLARGWGLADAGPIRAALVLCADHELNVSAFTARCIASADARLEHVLLGALCAFRGRRHGGMSERVAALLDDAERIGVDRALDRALAEQGAVPGFGHLLYPDGDPRAAELLRIAPSRGVARTVLRRCEHRLGLAANLDFGLAMLTRALGTPSGSAAAIFALGRSVGWIAHAFETWDSSNLIRPRARYVGPTPASRARPQAGRQPVGSSR